MMVCKGCGQAIDLWFHIGCPVGPGCPEGFDLEAEIEELQDQVQAASDDADFYQHASETESQENAELKQFIRDIAEATSATAEQFIKLQNAIRSQDRFLI